MDKYVWIAEIRYSIEDDYKWSFLFAAESLEAAKADIVRMDSHHKFWEARGYTYTRKFYKDWNEKGVYETIRIHRVSLVCERVALEAVS